MLSRLTLASFILVGLTYVMALQGQETKTPAPPKGDSGQIKEKLSLEERILASKYQEFEQQLLRLKQRMKLSDKQEDRDRAAVLDKVLEYCKERSLSVQFEQMIDLLKSKELRNVPDIKQALERSTQIADELKIVVAMLREDTKASQLRSERERLEKLLKDLEKIIQNQKAVEGLTQQNRTDKAELEKLQKKVTEKTAELAKQLGDGSGKEGKNTKGDPKAGGKNGDQAAKSKDGGESAKSGDPKSGDPKSGDPKSGDPKSAEAKAGEAKAGGDSKEPKATAKAGEAGKPGEKSGEKSGAKPGEGAEAKAGAKGSKSGEAGKSGEAKAKSGSPSEAQAKGEAKAGSKSDGQSQAKGSGSPSQSPPPPGQQQASAKGSNQPPPPPSKSGPKDNPTNGKKQVEDAEYKQKSAEEKIEQGKNDDASNKQNDAIKDLEAAKKELEKLLRQIREEEVERLLAALQARCEKMLILQQQVLVGTQGVDKAIIANEDRKANRNNKQDSLKLSDQEGDIVVEANKAIEMLEAEGSAIAFPEVFQQVREDMKHVQRRLGITDVQQVTQAIEQDIIDTLKEMIEALKKKRDENKSPPPKSGDGNPPPPQDQKLLDRIAELKMIRSMQVRINSRTQTYGKMYQGEQAGENNIRRELHNLSERQERIYEITNRMAKGDNQ